MEKIKVTKDMALSQLRNVLDHVFESIESMSNERPLFQSTVSLMIKRLQEMGDEEKEELRLHNMQGLVDALHYLTAVAVIMKQENKESLNGE